MTYHYQRCGVHQFDQLSLAQQKEIMDLYFTEKSDAYSTGYVLCGEAVLPISHFVPIGSPGQKKPALWHSFLSTSGISGYYLKATGDGLTALVAYRHF